MKFSFKHLLSNAAIKSYENSFLSTQAPFIMYVKFSENHFISPDMHLVHVIIVGGAREKL